MRRFYLKNYVLLLALMLVSGFAFAQSGSISGTVLDTKRESLPGVSVTVDGTTVGTATDMNGAFKLNSVSAGTHTITAKYIGYTTLTKTVTVTAGQTTNVEFLLTAESQSLNEVVVIGYGTQQKKELTGSIATVSSKDFQKGTITSPEQLINGKVAGVQIVSGGGQPGAGSEIRIRAGASLNASKSPLIVVDNVPLNADLISGVANPLTLINPNDIETFTVLKDANATAIYGSRASNGVILITTKKGASGKPQINFSTNNSLSTANRKVNVLSTNQLRDYVNTNGNATQKGLLGDASTNWQNEIFRNAYTTDNNLSVSGSAKNTPYRVNIGYLNQDGILMRDNMNRVSGAIGISPKFFDKHLKVDLNIKGTYSKSTFANQGAIGSAIMFDPTQTVRDTSSKYGDYFEWQSGANPNPNTPRNPVALINLKDDKGRAARSFGNLQLDYTFHFLPEMRANLNVGYDVSRGQGTTVVPDFAAQNYSTQGLRSRYMNDVSNKVLEFYLAYKKDFKSINSNLDAIAGYGYYDNKRTTNNYSSYRFDGTTAISNPVFPFDIQQSRLLSYYGRAIYTYAGKYILSGTIRTDGSSRFSPEDRHRWGVFPSGAFTWRISEEPMLKSSNTLSDLKLRVSYGVTGQQDGIGNYTYQPIYGLSANESQYQFGNQFYYMYAPTAYDKDLRWESTATTNIGIDYGFLNGRISGAVDVFYKKTKDLLAVVNIPVGSNFSNQLLTNVGNMENKGVEFSINGAAIKSKSFNWDLGFNFTYLENKVTNLTLVPDDDYFVPATTITGATGNYIQYHTINRAPNSFYVYKQVYGDNGKPLEGVYEDLDGDGSITASDRYFYKNPAPKFLMGFTTSVNYQKWTVATVLRASIGNYMYDNISSNLATRSNILNSGGSINNAPVDFLNTGFTVNQYNSDYYVKNASFLKMDNLSLSYNAGRVANSFNLSVSANVQNVFVVSKYKGLDPEVFTGIDYNLYPRPRIYTLGLNVGF
ncbi:SusC/RagA family TonB-linked outer membrane protein [Mucilaginibacter roseus]|uniref:SusC/RagA family TonB-linked outer membrane protein n=1 Tax=Mucilaginibacter roseus TaxID=1528868 RepID=A0ABS8U8G8_9SPHI|nr:SusC/RagA family TonB-linked outer membrane protein [Mucilaginibacter roseus]MCD8742274.1 SusC/RagA family TonB-linked outer membrane protein [Mucilaginibacter roseus]